MPDKRKGRRVTPRQATSSASSSASSSAGREAGPLRRRFVGPNVPVEGPVQAGRRPSNPIVLLVTAAVWIGCGLIALVSLTAGWKLIPGVVFIGIGLLFLRGAAATIARR